MEPRLNLDMVKCRVLAQLKVHVSLMWKDGKYSKSIFLLIVGRINVWTILHIVWSVLVLFGLAILIFNLKLNHEFLDGLVESFS